MKTRHLFILVIVIQTTAFAAGKTGLSFLKVGLGSKMAAMGNTAVATSLDASVLMWNPASIAALTERQASLSYHQWLEDIKHQAGAIVFPSAMGHWGLSLLLTDIPGIEHRETATPEPLGEISAHDISIGLSYAKRITANLFAGLTAKYLYEKIFVETSHGFAVDAGLFFHPDVPGLNMGLSVQNLGAMSDLANEPIDLPATARAGLSYQPPYSILGLDWLFTSDFVSVFETGSHIHMGSQVRIMGLLALRAGYQTGYEEKSFSAGFGLDFDIAEFDYAYIPFQSDLGNTQQFTLCITF